MDSILPSGKRRLPYMFVWLLVWLFIGMTLSDRAYAHAMLLEAQPVSGAHLDKFPSRMSLAFSERLERGMYHLQVLGIDGHPIPTQPAQLSQDHKQLSLSLPEMPDGIYTVTYNIQSIDGHPVGGSYTFVAGDVPQSQAVSREVAPHDGGPGGWSDDLINLFLYIFRTVYMTSMLCLAGWMIWLRYSGTGSESLQQYRMRWLRALQRVFLLSLLVSIGLQLTLTLRNGAVVDLSAMLLTVQGKSWMVGLIFAIASCFAYRRSAWAGLAGMAIVLAAESLNGHAVAAETNRAILVNFVHLLAASLWAGGLLYLLAHYGKFREHAKAFLPRFSAVALASMIVLIVTGTASTLLYLPKIEYVFDTAWGKLLILKTGCVLFVMLTGAFLRLRIKRRRMGEIGRLLKADITLMVVIMGIAGVFTLLNPQPQNQPFYWKISSEPATIMTEITPFAVGANHIKVEASLPDVGSKAPKAIKLLLRSIDGSMSAPIEVQLTQSSFDYSNEAAYIPFPGKWEVELRIMTADDEETVYRRTRTIY